MANPVNGVLSVNDAVTQLERIYPDIVKTSRVYAPVLMDHMSAVSKTGSKTQWFHQAISQGFITLANNYTIGDATMTISAPTNFNPFNTELKAGVSKIATNAGTLQFSVDGINSSTEIQISVALGTDANLTAGTKLYIQRDGDFGEGFKAHNDTSVATTDFNFITNFYHDLGIASPIAEGKFEYAGTNELSFGNQEENLLPTVVRQMERRVLKDIRVEGSNPQDNAGFSRTAGTGAQAGGVYYYINNNGGYTVTSGNAGLTEDTIETDLIELRERGAFQNMDNYERSYAGDELDAVISEVTLGDIQRQVRLQRENAQGNDGGPGLGNPIAPYAIVNGVKVNFKLSSGMGDNEVLYLPKQKDLIKVEVLRMFEEPSEKWGDGDAVKGKYATTFSTCVKAPWVLGYRTNLSRV